MWKYSHLSYEERYAKMSIQAFSKMARACFMWYFSDGFIIVRGSKGFLCFDYMWANINLFFGICKSWSKKFVYKFTSDWSSKLLRAVEKGRTARNFGDKACVRSE